jgi:hypothetical protein
MCKTEHTHTRWLSFVAKIYIETIIIHCFGLYNFQAPTTLSTHIYFYLLLSLTIYWLNYTLEASSQLLVLRPLTFCIWQNSTTHLVRHPESLLSSWSLAVKLFDFFNSLQIKSTLYIATITFVKLSKSKQEKQHLIKTDQCNINNKAYSELLNLTQVDYYRNKVSLIPDTTTFNLYTRVSLLTIQQLPPYLWHKA